MKWMYFRNFSTLIVKYSYLYFCSHGVYGSKVKKRNKHQYVNECHLISHHWSNNYSHQGIIYALKNQIWTWKLVANERFPLLPPDYGTSSPFELFLMSIFLNLSRKRFFLKRYMTFSFIIFVFSFSFLFKMCML